MNYKFVTFYQHLSISKPSLHKGKRRGNWMLTNTSHSLIEKVQGVKIIHKPWQGGRELWFWNWVGKSYQAKITLPLHNYPNDSCLKLGRRIQYKSRKIS